MLQIKIAFSGWIVAFGKFQWHRITPGSPGRPGKAKLRQSSEMAVTLQQRGVHGTFVRANRAKIVRWRES